MYPNIQSSTIYNSQDMEATQLSINRWMDKEDMEYNIYTMEYYLAIKGKKTESFVVMLMNLESVIQSEVSQKEKNKYHILTYIWNPEKWYWWTYSVGQE